MGSENFRIEKQDGIARCTMKGPNMNSLSNVMLPALMEGMRSVLDDDEVRVIVLRGDEGNFCTGADLTTMGDKMDPAMLCAGMRAMGDFVYEIHEGPKPVIAEVDGWAVGGGFGLAMAADITYATERARFFLSWTKLSILPDFGSAYFLTRRVGLSIAKELALTAAIIDADEALRIGLINRVVPHEEISDAVMKLAGKLARRTPNVLATTKRWLNTGHQVDLQTFLDLEAYSQALAVVTPEHDEAIKEFFSKRSGSKE
ncbi:MAG: enoyl-CoA hydratase/isomerase family protein [Actinobacteria bacterium]|nr:enoyl-CoA hydratase/isomerase family protein [Actinomycetota bacterium]